MIQLLWPETLRYHQASIDGDVGRAGETFEIDGLLAGSVGTWVERGKSEWIIGDSQVEVRIGWNTRRQGGLYKTISH